MFCLFLLLWCYRFVAPQQQNFTLLPELLVLVMLCEENAAFTWMALLSFRSLIQCYSNLAICTEKAPDFYCKHIKSIHTLVA